MVLIGLGGNLPSEYGSPRQTLEAALAAIERGGGRVVARSRWWRTAPVPVSDQPWFVNGVAALDTALDPQALLALLHAIERDFGRVRGARNAARIIDLDVLAYHDQVLSGPVEIPHPRLHERAFVLFPLADVAPMWRHPVFGAGVAEMIAALGEGQTAEPEE